MFRYISDYPKNVLINENNYEYNVNNYENNCLTNNYSYYNTNNSQPMNSGYYYTNYNRNGFHFNQFPDQTNGLAFNYQQSVNYTINSNNALLDCSGNHLFIK